MQTVSCNLDERALAGLRKLQRQLGMQMDELLLSALSEALAQ